MSTKMIGLSKMEKYIKNEDYEKIKEILNSDKGLVGKILESIDESTKYIGEIKKVQITYFEDVEEHYDKIFVEFYIKGNFKTHYENFLNFIRSWYIKQDLKFRCLINYSLEELSV